ncbi:glycosyl hydrolase family 28-related protein [Streptacidiphilus neutrinimicus]|uniref:glycosyl hydrolase family 28-related protein n=1 Tax=Streptacidiphilus neutrinimicus TaxID=105420 RepID=UPI0005A705CD|nr:glycosyl hydrolase family 28-related protein [Streptacidiphilus neutrinimicus]
MTTTPLGTGDDDASVARAPVLTRRRSLALGAVGAGLGLGIAARATSAAAAPARAVVPGAADPTVFDVTTYGARGDGHTDDTRAIQKALATAGAVPGSEVWFPPAPGGCYRTTGVTVPGGVAALTGRCTLKDSDAPTVATLTGSVLAPLDTTTAGLLTVGVSGDGSFVGANPHGLTVDGLGFLGTAPGGGAVVGMWGATIVDTSDVTFVNCRDLYCGSPGFHGYPSGGDPDGTGGFARFLSSGTDNWFAVNGRVLSCSSYGAGTFVLADGLSTAHPGGGSTDGRISGCQANGHNHAVQLGPALAGAGGWSVTDCHFSSAEGASHITYGLAGTPWTLRVEGCYFDLCADVHIDCHGRGLQAVGNYFRALGGRAAISFGHTLATAGRDPAALLTGNVLDLDGSTTTACFAHFCGFTADVLAAHGGGQYAGNLVHNHGAPMPKSWVGQFMDSARKPVTAASTAELDLAAGPVLSA